MTYFSLETISLAVQSARVSMDDNDLREHTVHNTESLHDCDAILWHKKVSTLVDISFTSMVSEKDSSKRKRKRRGFINQVSIQQKWSEVFFMFPHYRFYSFNKPHPFKTLSKQRRCRSYFKGLFDLSMSQWQETLKLVHH